MSNRGKDMRLEYDIRNQEDLVKRVAKEMKLPIKTVNKLINQTWEIICDEIEEGNTVKLHGKGTFYLSERAARMGRNPQTGEEHQVPDREVMAFRVSPAYAKRLRKIRHNISDK